MGPGEVSLIRTLIPSHGLHSHDLITSQSLCLPTPPPLRVRISTCNASIQTTASTYCFLFFFFFNICLGPSGLSHGMQDLQCIVTDLLLWPGLGTAREILVPQPGI